MADLSKFTKAELLAFIGSHTMSSSHSHCVNVTTKHVFDTEEDALECAHSSEKNGGYVQVRTGKFDDAGTWLKGATVEVIYKTR